MEDLEVLAGKRSNYDKIRNMTLEEMADYFCESMEECRECVANKYCRRGHRGFLDWLAEVSE